MFVFNIDLFVYSRGKKKLAQAAKETKEQLASLQSKLEMANTGSKNDCLKKTRSNNCFFLEMTNRDNKIESLENDIEILKNEAKTTEVTERKTSISRFFSYYCKC